MKKPFPVYHLTDFSGTEPDFYANELKPHVAIHPFTHLPHKHDFYLVILVTKGSGFHEIDFRRYKVKPGSVFFMQPGQMHYWKFSKDIKGYVLFHSKAFYNGSNSLTQVQDYPFYRSTNSFPCIHLSSSKQEETASIYENIIEEFRQNKSRKAEKLHAYLNILYIELSREYKGIEHKEKQLYLERLHQFETLIENHFKEHFSAKDYAAMLSISEKHLNRIVRITLNKTTTQLIAERLVLEARRLLIQGKLNITQLADELGFTDPSYFVRLFKKHSGETPGRFLKNY